MNCAIYKSLKKTDTYLYVEGEAGLERVPDALMAALGRLEFVMNLELSPGRRLAQADVQRVREQLASDGYYLQLPPKDRPFDAVV